ncbi:hypothetical protein SUGI_0916650 [Cryptomeria japonica]|uniref:protein OXIDATIVE STRESS 3 LIKE 2 n=1 Tax=Cryptomeria japonica TaxID=3369 RepID=UPI00241496CD|nr:protein OXIDATIVE STRESS 3 LIKE 2 [Cryptomeria japonica]GLJ43969.1 hypothetical protein SUGI_0916650 [Cryptomeria japonica]
MGSLEDCFVPAISMDDKASTLFSLTDSMAMDSTSTSSCSSNDLPDAHAGPLYHMGSLIAGLPCRRGLSNFYGGKSQSFSSLEDVKCVEHLAKPENSYYRRKKLKGCHECGLKHSKSYEPRISSASMISKRPQKGSTMMKKAASFFLSSGLPVSPANTR